MVVLPYERGGGFWPGLVLHIVHRKQSGDAGYKKILSVRPWLILWDGKWSLSQYLFTFFPGILLRKIRPHRIFGIIRPVACTFENAISPGDLYGQMPSTRVELLIKMLADHGF